MDSNKIGDGYADGIYPNYGEDETIFGSFIEGHQILITNPKYNQKEIRASAEDKDELLEQEKFRRVPCYAPLLQRIKNRHYYIDKESTNNFSTSNVFVIEIPLSELIAWDPLRGRDLANRVLVNTLRYIELFCTVIDSILDSMHATNTLTNIQYSADVLLEQRVTQRKRIREALLTRDGGESGTIDVDGAESNLRSDPAILGARNNGVTDTFPPTLMRRYELRILPIGRKGCFAPFVHKYDDCGFSISHQIINGKGDKIVGRENMSDGISLRHVRSQSLGRLVSIEGMIVRASDVKPCCVVATYVCDMCGCEIYQVVEAKRDFLPQRVCPTPACVRIGRAETLHLQTRGSKFVKFQELKMQELPSQVPMGHVPRSMSVLCRGELTRLVSPGDVVTIDGIFLPQRIVESRNRAVNSGLISSTFLEAQNIIVYKKSYNDSSLINSLSEEERNYIDREIMVVATGDDPIGLLSSSIAPEIFGHEDIKRALLLQLVGGCTRKLPDGMRIRGDINICLMGDPGVAKSQLLKHVATIAPRGVYTTGRGSSGVGLTAAITKDFTTGEMALEGGALVLADRGVCAIDEFDKMDESDRTAIHEVMEQQTVSIAKAGIVATLNARAAVLAAANPLYGRYNRKKSLSENVNLPNSLLSRFDLLFLILDTTDAERDMALARHVTFVHQNEGLGLKSKTWDTYMDGNKNATCNTNNKTVIAVDKFLDAVNGKDSNMDMENEDLRPTISSRILREYISQARKFRPVVPPDVAPYIVEAYVGLRMEESEYNGIRDQTAMTARQLLSILRLSQALARLRFSDYVAREDVDEAIRLTHASKSNLIDDNFNIRREFGNSGKVELGSWNNYRHGNKFEDITSRIFRIIKDYTTLSHTDKVEVKMCEAMILRKGFTVQQLQSCIQEYKALDVIQLNNTGTHIHFL